MKCIIVSNEGFGQTSLFAILRNAGWEISLTADQDQAVRELLVQGVTDIVFVNTSVPGQLALINRFRVKDQGVKIILFGNFKSLDLATEAKRLGANACLAVPFNMERLRQEIVPRQG